MSARIVRRLVSLVAISLVILLLPIASASAKPLVREHYSDAWDFSYMGCGFEVHAEGTASGLFILKPGKHGSPTPYIMDKWKSFEVQTNPANGKWFSVSANGLYKETSIVHVTGTIYRFEAFYAGQPFVVRDMDGNVVMKDRGNLRISFEVDTLGDSDPDNDEFIEGSTIVLRDSGAHPGFYVDWCEMVNDLIG